MAEERTLPGWPKKKLVKEVRRHLSYYGIRPVKFKSGRPLGRGPIRLPIRTSMSTGPCLPRSAPVYPAPVGRDAAQPLPAIALSGQGGCAP